MLSRDYLHGAQPLPPSCLFELSHVRRHIICGVVFLHCRLIGWRYRILLVLPRGAHKLEPLIHYTTEARAPLEFRVRHLPLIGIIIQLVVWCPIICFFFGLTIRTLTFLIVHVPHLFYIELINRHNLFLLILLHYFI